MILYLEYVGFSKNGGLSPDCGYFIGNKSNWPVNWDFEHKKWMRTKTKNLRTGMLRVENLKFGCWANQKKDFEHKTFGLTANQLQDFWPSTMLDRSQNRVHHPREQWNIHEHWPLILGKNKVFCSPCALGAALCFLASRSDQRGSRSRSLALVARNGSFLGWRQHRI